MRAQRRGQDGGDAGEDAGDDPDQRRHPAGAQPGEATGVGVGGRRGDGDAPDGAVQEPAEGEGQQRNGDQGHDLGGVRR